MIRRIIGNSISLYIALVVLFLLFWLVKKIGPVSGLASTAESFAQPH